MRRELCQHARGRVHYARTHASPGSTAIAADRTLFVSPPRSSASRSVNRVIDERVDLGRDAARIVAVTYVCPFSTPSSQRVRDVASPPDRQLARNAADETRPRRSAGPFPGVCPRSSHGPLSRKPCSRDEGVPCLQGTDVIGRGVDAGWRLRRNGVMPYGLAVDGGIIQLARTVTSPNKQVAGLQDLMRIQALNNDHPCLLSLNRDRRPSQRTFIQRTFWR